MYNVYAQYVNIYTAIKDDILRAEVSIKYPSASQQGAYAISYLPHCSVMDVCDILPTASREEGGEGRVAGVLRRTICDHLPRPPAVTAHTCAT